MGKCAAFTANCFLSCVSRYVQSYAFVGIDNYIGSGLVSSYSSGLKRTTGDTGTVLARGHTHWEVEYMGVIDLSACTRPHSHCGGK